MVFVHGVAVTCEEGREVFHEDPEDAGSFGVGGRKGEEEKEKKFGHEGKRVGRQRGAAKDGDSE